MKTRVKLERGRTVIMEDAAGNEYEVVEIIEASQASSRFGSEPIKRRSVQLIYRGTILRGLPDGTYEVLPEGLRLRPIR